MSNTHDQNPQNNNNITALREEYNNAKERLNHQSTTFQTFASESHKMLRITLVFAGLLFTAVTALGPETVSQTITSSNCSVYISPSNCFTINDLGFVLLISTAISVLAHMGGYEARGVLNFAETEDIDQVLTKAGMTEEEYIIDRLEKYRHRIKTNAGTIRVIESILVAGKASFAISSISLLLIVYVTSIGAVRFWATAFSMILISLIGGYFLWAFPKEYIKGDTGEIRRTLLRK
jgi:hypothetical protein